MIISPNETLDRAALKRLQGERLTALVPRLRERVPLYRDRLAGIADPRSLDDLGSLPFTRKSDLRDAYPLGMLAVPVDTLARVHASSGTTGNPTIGAYTANDLGIWADAIARCLGMAELARGEMLQVSYGYGLFTGGLGVHGGAEALGVCVVPASSGNTARQMQLLEALPIAAIACTPSYALLLAERFRESGRRPKALRVAICGAEAWTKEMRGELETLLGAQALNIYGLTEIIGPGVAQECLHAKNGLHVNEDHFLAEILDPQTQQPLADGERGELVLTTLTREAMPVLRYRTGDLTRMLRERCTCGRTTARIDWLTGRVDDMLIVRGVNVFPTAIEEVLLGFRELTPNYRIFVDRERGGLDELTLEVERHPEHTVAVDALADALAARLFDTLTITVVTRIIEPGTIERVEAGKVKRVYDRRGMVSA